MLDNFVRYSAVQVFAWIAKLGVHRLPAFDRVFLVAYTAYKRCFEAGPIDRLREFVPAGSIVLDVGANVGFFTERFAQWVGDGEVIAIEPEEKNFCTLVKMLGRRGLQRRVRTLRAVATATGGTSRLAINPVHPADHKLSLDDTGVTIEAVRLDDLILDKGPQRPSLIKIDVQGAEMLVLQGAPEILTRAKPALFVELSDVALQQFGSSVAEVIDLLSPQGYEPFWLMSTGPHRQASRDEIRNRMRQHGYVDVLFLNSAGRS